MPRSVSGHAVDGSSVGLIQCPGADVLVGAESRPAGLEAQQAQKPAVGAGDSGPPTPRRDHRLAHFGQAGPGRHGAARESPQRRGRSIKSLKHTTAIFRQVNKETPHVHHDSLEFPDGQMVLLTELCEGQEATVLQLPAQPATPAEAEAQKRAVFIG